MLKISVSDLFHFDTDSDPDPRFKNMFLQKMICFLIVLLFMRQIFVSVKQKINIFEKIYDIIVILVDFC